MSRAWLSGWEVRSVFGGGLCGALSVGVSVGSEEVMAGVCLGVGSGIPEST